MNRDLAQQKRDFSDFAQEFLRRNPSYREDFRQAGRGKFGSARSIARQKAARSWGLEFPF